METIVTYKYHYNELDEDAKQKAIQQFRDDEFYLSYDWWDWTVEEIKEELSELGVDDADIEFSGFYNQGDGAKFMSNSVHLPKMLESLKLRDKYPELVAALDAGKLDWSCHIENTWRQGSHAYCAKFRLDSFDYIDDDAMEEDDNTPYIKALDIVQEQFNKLADELEEWRIDYCHTIYRRLEKEYEYLYSDECIIETIEANDYLFDKDGTF